MPTFFLAFRSAGQAATRTDQPTATGSWSEDKEARRIPWPILLPHRTTLSCGRAAQTGAAAAPSPRGEAVFAEAAAASASMQAMFSILFALLHVHHPVHHPRIHTKACTHAHMQKKRSTLRQGWTRNYSAPRSLAPGPDLIPRLDVATLACQAVGGGEFWWGAARRTHSRSSF